MVQCDSPWSKDFREAAFLWALATLIAPFAFAFADAVDASGGRPAGNDSTLHYLDTAHRTWSCHVEAMSGSPGAAKFVQVKITEVVNPNRVALTFMVAFQEGGKASVQLGEFSLYPADNPGTFIVSTRGVVHGTGVIAVSMTIGDPINASSVIRVGIGGVALI